MSEALHARLKAEREEGETLGETSERLLGEYGLVDFADDMAEVAEAHPSDEELQQAIDESDERTKEEIGELLP